MKTIGRTNDGAIIVEMSTLEHEVYTRLVDATNGMRRDEMFVYGPDRRIDVDTTKALTAVTRFVEARLQVNEIRALADRLLSVIEVNAK